MRGGELLTTSSVYDIEHFDFLEPPSAARCPRRGTPRAPPRRAPWDVIEHDGELLFGLDDYAAACWTEDGRTFEHRAVNDAAVLAMATMRKARLLSSVGDLLRLNGEAWMASRKPMPCIRRRTPLPQQRRGLRLHRRWRGGRSRGHL